MSLPDRIVLWLRDQLTTAGAEGFTFGLSGGVDSATVAALAVRAVGPERVLAAILPCHSLPDDARLAQRVAETFGIPTVTVDLGGAYDALLAALPPSDRPLAAANVKPRLRMIAWYYLSQASRRTLVLGAGNKSEVMVGYTTKWGDSGVDLLPLGDLYKTQVWELARELGVPPEVVERPPTAGLWPGQTDEGEMGITYAELDRTLAAIEAGDTSGIELATLEKVQHMIARSAHKRALPPVFRANGEWRMANGGLRTTDYASILQAAMPLIELAIAEDIGPGDATSDAVLPPDLVLRGRILAKQAGIIAGLPVAEAVFSRVDPALVFQPHIQDGASVAAGDLVAEVVGPGRGMLAAERTVLNFLQRLSGIATLTRAFVEAAAGTHATILDTRKTHPGYRVLEKYAVRVGGGQNHRMGLHDMLLVKDNHIEAAGSITAAVERARAVYGHLPIEVEVKNLDELREALALNLDRVMLDNMDLDEMQAAVRLTAGRVPLEASGGVSLECVAAIAATGVDYISVGALTHSAPALDVSMEIESQISKSANQQIGKSANRQIGKSAIRNPQSAIRNPQSLISTAKSELGNQLVILGHHYQRDEVLQFADFRGDSLQLARDAAKCQQARYIVFCGVHFMAETAAILAQPGQTVLLPDLAAGCSLAEMADLPEVEQTWAQLGELMDVEGEVMPVTYVNSAADLKAFCGRHGGAVCTSSNAQAVVSWALARRPRVLFFPDQHLGGNTARRLGIPLEEMLVWNPLHPLGGHAAGALQRARVFLWRGWCCVHQRFSPQHVTAWREQRPGIRILVHPECTMEVVDLADDVGSTSYIIRRVEESPPGTQWAIGTEFNLVNRLRNEHPEQFIASLSPEPSTCRTMSLITLEKLARVVEGLARGELINPITVPPGVACYARIALERMLEAKP
ncbi:MAG TPA: quinolinate synthase NadA [Anaerolineae bacterium]|nr:quinolinate synthase NadA [Anaerolineae bacterium]